MSTRRGKLAGLALVSLLLSGGVWWYATADTARPFSLQDDTSEQEPTAETGNPADTDTENPPPLTSSQSIPTDPKVIQFQKDSQQQPPDPRRTFVVKIWADSGEEEVNVVQANLVYNAEKIKPLSLTPGSAFPNSAQAEDEAGMVKVARYTSPGTVVTGRHLVASVAFEDADGIVESVSLGEGSAIIGPTGPIVKADDLTLEYECESSVRCP